MFQRIQGMERGIYTDPVISISYRRTLVVVTHTLSHKSRNCAAAENSGLTRTSEHERYTYIIIFSFIEKYLQYERHSFGS